MRQHVINEDKLQPKMSVSFSSEIADVISNFNWHNRGNIEALSQWHYYIKGMVSYISNPVIAWDNMDRLYRSPDGKTHLNELGYDVNFIIKTNSTTNQSYVYIFDMNFNTEEFGLEQPLMYENQQLRDYNHKNIVRLTESDLCSMVKECVIKVLNKRASFLNENKESRALKRARKYDYHDGKRS